MRVAYLRVSEANGFVGVGREVSISDASLPTCFFEDQRLVGSGVPLLLCALRSPLPDLW